MGTSVSDHPDSEARRCSSCGEKIEGAPIAESDSAIICESCLSAKTVGGHTPAPPPGDGSKDSARKPKVGATGIRKLLSLGIESDSRANAEEFEETVAHDSNSFLTRDTEAAPLPEDGIIGSFQIIGKLGTGGFGDVYQAKQHEPVEREVALKVLKPGMDSREIVKRFELERQTLAMMEHPNIARVIDAGETTSGNPYFVMELVRGEPVTHYCDRRHLGIRERLAIFQQICAGVQHAHQKGIIHRDLKPSNILVEETDRQPLPKIIDFGVSKAVTGGLDDSTVYTLAGQAIGTPQYMSPEQAGVDDQGVDTRSDIYSLGVVLYELLTGETPITPREFQAAGLMAFAELILEKTPARPSTRIGKPHASDTVTVANERKSTKSGLRKMLRQDLDWIVMMALEKDRNRRYESAAAFSDDISRFLKHQPVVASPPSRLYALKKFARRQRVPLMAGAAVFCALILGAVVSVWQAIRAMEESERARMAEKESALQRDAANAVNLVDSEPLRALEIMERVTDESELLFGKLSPPVTNALVNVLENARETARIQVHSSIAADTIEAEALTAVLSTTQCYLIDLRKSELKKRISVTRDADVSPVSVALFPGGERIAVGYSDGTLAIVSTTEGLPETEWDAGKGVAVNEIELSADGEKILTLDAEGRLSPWSANGESLGKIVQLDTSSIPEFLASDERNDLTVSAGIFAEAPFFSLVDFSLPDPAPQKIETPGKTASALAVRADGGRFLTGFQDGTIQIWNRDGTPLGSHILAHRATIWRLAFVEGTNWIASAATDGEVRIWGEGGEAMSSPMVGVAGEITELSSLENGRFLSGVFANGTVLTWDNLGSQARPGIYMRAVAEQVAFPRSRPDEMLVGLADGRLGAVDWNTSGEIIREVRISEGAILGMTLNRKETQLAMVVRESPNLYVVDYPEFETVREIPTKSKSLRGVEFAGENDETIVTTGNDGALYAVDPQTGEVKMVSNIGHCTDPNAQIIRLKNQIPPFTHLAAGGRELGMGVLFSADGKWKHGTPRGISLPLAVETEDGIATIAGDLLRFGIREDLGYDFDENDRPQTVARGHPTESMALSQPIGTIAAGTRGGLLKLFDNSGQSISPLLRAHRLGFETISAHPADPLFVSTGHDGWIRFWGSHPEVWKRSLKERTSPTLPASTFSMPPIHRKDTRKISSDPDWDSAISVKEAGFAMRSHETWRRASPASLAAVNQLVVKGLGNRLKRVHFAAILYNNLKKEQSAFLHQDAVLAVEIPEFSHPYAFADRVPDLANQLHWSITHNLGGAISIDSEGISISWDESLSAAEFQAELKFRGNREGLATGYWIPSHGSTVLIGSVMSHRVSSEEEKLTRENREVQDRFLESIREQVSQAVIHEDNRPSPNEMAEIQSRIEAGSIRLLEQIFKKEIREIEKILTEANNLRSSQPEKALNLIDEYMSQAELQFENSEQLRTKNLWRGKIISGYYKKSQILRSLKKKKESLTVIQEALAMVSDKGSDTPYNPAQHVSLLRELYYIYRDLANYELARTTGEESLKLSREIAASSHVGGDKKGVGLDLQRIADDMIRDGNPRDQIEPLLYESLDIANELLKDRNYREGGLDLARIAEEKLARVHSSAGEFEQAITRFENSIELLEEMRTLRPDAEQFQRTFCRLRRSLAIYYLKKGEQKKFREAFSHSLRETNAWMNKFGREKKHLHLASNYDFFGTSEVFSMLSKSGLHPLNAECRKKELEHIEQWPAEILNHPRIIDLRTARLSELARHLFDHLIENPEACIAYLNQAEKIILSWISQQDSPQRKKFISSYFRVFNDRNFILERSKQHPAIAQKIDHWNTNQIGWLENAVALIPPIEQWSRPEDLGTIDRIGWILASYCWKINSAEARKETVQAAEKLVAWRQLSAALSPGNQGRQKGLVDALRTILVFLRSDERALTEMLPYIESGRTAIESLKKTGPLESDSLSKIAEFYQVCFDIHRSNDLLDEAEFDSGAAISHLKQYLEQNPENTGVKLRLADYTYRLAALGDRIEPSRSISLAEESLQIYRAISSQSAELEEKHRGSIQKVEKFLKEMKSNKK